MSTRAGLAIAVGLLIAMPAAGPAVSASADRPHARTNTTLDDRQLTRSGVWQAKAFSGAHAGTLSKSKAKGATLISTTATVNGGTVVLQFGPDRGKVDVLVGGVKQKTVKTEAKRPKLKQVSFSGQGMVALKCARAARAATSTP